MAAYKCAHPDQVMIQQVKGPPMPQVKHDQSVSRRAFVSAGAVGIAGLTLTAPRIRAATRSGSRARAVPDGFPHQDPALVRDTVRYSHFDLDAVRELVTARPELAKASWDWGFGDWESALGAASHTGQRGIADLLIEHGARPNLFTYAMMGNLAAVKAMIEAQPGVQRIPGPHGITLLDHAEHGGEEAKDVLAYLESLGDANPTPINKPLEDSVMKGCLGTYTLDVATGESIDIVESRGMLSVKHPNISGRPLFHQGDYEFHPSGAPGFIFAFDVVADSAKSVTLRSGGDEMKAMRVA